MRGNASRPVRFLALCLFALATPAAHAQDVIVLPPSSSTTTPAPVAQQAPAPSTVAVATTPQSTGPTIPPMPAQYLQCGANSDCILSDGGCSSPTAVNGNYDAAWRAQLAAASPTCQAYTSAMMQQLAQTNVPVCIANQCAIQLIQPVSNQ